MLNHKKKIPYRICGKNNCLEIDKIQAESENIEPIKTRIIKTQDFCVLFDFKPLESKKNNIVAFIAKEKIEHANMK